MKQDIDTKELPDKEQTEKLTEEDLSQVNAGIMPYISASIVKQLLHEEK